MSRTDLPKIKWYYDACVLDELWFSDIMNEGTNRHCPKMIVLSHLALGEAFGNIYNKKKPEALLAFTDFINSLKKAAHVSVVGNDDDNYPSLFDQIRGDVSELSITDAIHVATAIKEECCNIISNDRDINGLSDFKLKKIKDRAAKLGVLNFCITKH